MSQWRQGSAAMKHFDSARNNKRMLQAAGELFLFARAFTKLPGRLGHQGGIAR